MYNTFLFVRNYGQIESGFTKETAADRSHASRAVIEAKTDYASGIHLGIEHHSQNEELEIQQDLDGLRTQLASLENEHVELLDYL